MIGLKMEIDKYKYQTDTPAILFDEMAILKVINKIRDLFGESCETLFSLKSFSILDVLQLMEPLVDGEMINEWFED